MNIRQSMELSIANCCPQDCELRSVCKDDHQRMAREEVSVALARLSGTGMGQVLVPPLRVVAVTRCAPECTGRSGDGMPDVLPDTVVTVTSAQQ